MNNKLFYENYLQELTLEQLIKLHNIVEEKNYSSFTIYTIDEFKEFFILNSCIDCCMDSETISTIFELIDVLSSCKEEKVYLYYNGYNHLKYATKEKDLPIDTNSIILYLMDNYEPEELQNLTF